MIPDGYKQVPGTELFMEMSSGKIFHTVSFDDNSIEDTIYYNSDMEPIHLWRVLNMVYKGGRNDAKEEIRKAIFE